MPDSGFKKLKKSLHKDLPRIQLIKQGRALISEGNLKLINSKKEKMGYYFLFNDVFIFTNSSQNQLKFFAPLKEVVLRDKTGGFELIHDRVLFVENYTLDCESQSDKEELFGQLEENIKTCQAVVHHT